MKTIGICGNIVIDDFPINLETVRKITAELKARGIDLETAPKQTVPDLERVLSELKETMLIRLGGGGYNSCKTLSQVSPWQLIYYDLSRSPEEFGSLISGPRYHFKGLAELCKSIIINSPNERRIAKSPRYDKTLVLDIDQVNDLAETFQYCDAILINSIANPNIAERVANDKRLRDKKRYIVVTKNFSGQQIKDFRLLKGATALIDQEESDAIGGTGKVIYEDIKQTLELLAQLGAENRIVTMGKDGVAYSDTHFGKRLASTSAQFEACVQEYVRRRDVGKNGAGDSFAASLLYYHLSTGNLDEAIRKAQGFIVKKFLRYPYSKKGDFESYPMKL